jgi:hypothetical protein
VRLSGTLQQRVPSLREGVVTAALRLFCAVCKGLKACVVVLLPAALSQMLVCSECVFGPEGLCDVVPPETQGLGLVLRTGVTGHQVVCIVRWGNLNKCCWYEVCRQVQIGWKQLPWVPQPPWVHATIVQDNALSSQAHTVKVKASPIVDISNGDITAAQAAP